MNLHDKGFLPKGILGHEDSFYFCDLIIKVLPERCL